MPPGPAVFSSCSGQPSDSASASAISDPARSIAALASPPSLSADPGCRTTARAPSSEPARSDAVSEVRDFARISASSEAQLSR